MAIVVNLLRICLCKGLDLGYEYEWACWKGKKCGLWGFLSSCCKQFCHPSIHTEETVALSWFRSLSEEHMHLVSHEALNVPKSKPYTHTQSLLLSLSNDFHMFLWSALRCGGVYIAVSWGLNASSLVCGGWRVSDVQEHSASRDDLLIENKTACVCVWGRWRESNVWVSCLCYKGSTLLSKGHHLSFTFFFVFCSSHAGEVGGGAAWISLVTVHAV